MREEPSGFREFVAGRSPALLRTAWMLTGDAQLAEDLLQTALARTWPHWSRIEDGNHEAYVRRVMVRTNGAWWHRTRRGETPVAAPPEPVRPAPPDAYRAVDDRAALTQALARLPRRQRQVVVLRYYDDLPERQVATLLGCSVGTVKSQAAKGLAKLRAALADDADVAPPPDAARPRDDVAPSGAPATDGHTELEARVEGTR
jgi:RNA polymerase sigma-70 factor (sigma-E family)